MISALALASYGIASRIFEKNILNIDSFQKDIRNFALTEFSVNFFKEINIWKHLEEFIVPLQTVYVVDNKDINILELDSEILDKKPLGYMIKSSDLTSILFDLIQNNSLIETNFGFNYKDIEFQNISSQIIFENTQRIEAELIIVGDGKNSVFRKKYFKNSINHDYKQIALVFEIFHENPHDNSALEHFLPNGCFAVLPLLNKNKSSIVWAENTDSVNILKSLNHKDLLNHLYERIGSSYGKIEIISTIYNFPLYASFTNKYYYNNIVLIADAAHTIHPLAGQGLNQGIKDIKSLVNLITYNIKLGLEINSSMLAEYEKSRKFDNIRMFKITHYLDMVFANNIPILSKSRKILLSLANHIKPLKKLILKNAMRL
jgi:2-octaprenyl-6-methoxyphenol hydroxylase